VNWAPHYPYLKEKILGGSTVYTKSDNLDEAQLESIVGVPIKYTLNTIDDLPSLAQTLASDLTASTSTMKLSLVTIKEGVPLAGLDNIAKTLVNSANGVDATTFAVLTGKEGTLVSDLPPRALRQDVPTGTPQVTGKYLMPTALSAILISLFLITFLLIGYLRLMDVQTPYYFTAENIDWGKIEK